MEKVLKRTVVFVCLLCFLSGVLRFDFKTYALKASEIPKGSAVIDGKIDEVWEYASEKIMITNFQQGKESETASGWARLMWDEKNLYVLGFVTDKTPSYVARIETWYTDSFEFFIDEQNKHIAIDKFIDQFRVDRNGVLSGMIAHSIVDKKELEKTYKGIEWAIKQSDDASEYVVEYKIPWVKITPKADKTKIGVAFQINDDYNNDGIKLDGMVQSEVIDTWDPSTYPELKLVSDEAKISSGDSKEDDNSKNSSTQSESTSENLHSGKTESSKKEDSKDFSVNSQQSHNNSTIEDNSKNENVSENESSKEEDEKETENADVTTVTQTVNEKLLNTVIIVAICAVIVVGMLCTTSIIIVYKKK